MSSAFQSIRASLLFFEVYNFKMDALYLNFYLFVLPFSVVSKNGR
jgi:hypothetical protein